MRMNLIKYVVLLVAGSSQLSATLVAQDLHFLQFMKFPVGH